MTIYPHPTFQPKSTLNPHHNPIPSLLDSPKLNHILHPNSKPIPSLCIEPKTQCNLICIFISMLTITLTHSASLPANPHPHHQLLGSATLNLPPTLTLTLNPKLNSNLNNDFVQTLTLL